MCTHVHHICGIHHDICIQMCTQQTKSKYPEGPLQTRTWRAVQASRRHGSHGRHARHARHARHGAFRPQGIEARTDLWVLVWRGPSGSFFFVLAFAVFYWLLAVILDVGGLRLPPSFLGGFVPPRPLGGEVARPHPNFQHFFWGGLATSHLPHI